MVRFMIRLILSLLLVLSLSLSFTACGNKSGSVGTTKADDVSYNAEELEKRAVEMNKNEENFYGTWYAPSDNAKNLYGHLEITINEDGTFDADVTDEIFSGTWVKVDQGLEYTSELMNGKIFFGKTCRMVIEDSDVYVTLIKK